MMAANERNKCPRHTQIPAESESSGKVPFYRYTLFADTTRTGAAEGYFRPGKRLAKRRLVRNSAVRIGANVL